ncbi:DUF3035 domain-containing protein [Roseomonas terrae]|uniref:DUF3035 domain-containing protein n=1 Tax=Neoroseomonas terrae TaxID=424799 RepID=A0ABS5EN73_9PROT|nr:DUF3035 domain-containing protein [Neoroseomonas terrae]MBR0652474.1 DUF3035 domain-containing protein [Neoroseomonas terrae]
MRKRLPPVFVALALAALLPACGDSTARTLGLVRDAPDEFQVTTRAPLSMPPNMTTLPSPSPGSPRPQERSASQQAEALLSPSLALQDPRRAPGAAPSVGEAALIARAGPSAPDNIRRRVDEESLRLDQPDRALTDRLIFWRDPPPPGTPVDPAREQQRLRENAALGRDVESGETPVVQPQRRSFWSWLGL